MNPAKCEIGATQLRLSPIFGGKGVTELRDY